jgi:hypothetical protein
LNSYQLIAEWIAWKPGDGRSIRLGEDPVIGLSSQSFLTKELLQFIWDKGIYYLFQVHSTPGSSFSLSIWKSVEDLNMEGALVVEWNDFIKALNKYGIFLSNSSDELNWSWNERT